jgi:hypothetical protein
MRRIQYPPETSTLFDPSSSARAQAASGLRVRYSRLLAGKLTSRLAPSKAPQRGVLLRINELFSGSINAILDGFPI